MFAANHEPWMNADERLFQKAESPRKAGFLCLLATSAVLIRFSGG